jgi:hypothetical protein
VILLDVAPKRNFLAQSIPDPPLLDERRWGRGAALKRQQNRTYALTGKVIGENLVLRPLQDLLLDLVRHILHANHIINTISP